MPIIETEEPAGLNGCLRYILDLQQDVMPLQYMTTRPDPSWRFTDMAGHAHRWRIGPGEKTTVVNCREVEQEYWCDSCMDFVPETVWKCRLCGEEINPAMVVEQGDTKIAGPRRIEGSLTFSKRLPRGIGSKSGRMFQLARFIPGVRGRALSIVIAPDMPGNVRVDFLVIGELIRTDP